MCKTTKGAQSAAGSAVLGIQPNTGGGVVTPPPAVPVVTIRREHIPDIVFLAAGTDGALSNAVSFHQFFGLRGARLKRFSSIEHLVSQLTADATTLGRLRIVAHADNEGIFSPMTQGDVRVNIEKTELRAFLRGDAEWLLPKIRDRRHFLGTGSAARDVAEIILGHILQDTAARVALTAFNYTDTSHPNDQLVNFVLCAYTPAVVNGNFIKRDGANFTAAQKAIFITAYEKILLKCGTELISSAAYPGVGQPQLDSLKTAIRSFTLSSYNFTPGVSNIDTATVNSIVRSVTALNNNFRSNLVQVQQRFTGASWIDIRGCRAGTDRDYLASISEFFGRTGNQPHVSGPKWFQKFPVVGFNNFDSTVDIDNALNNGITGADATNIPGSAIRTAFDNWLNEIQYTQAYFTAWRNALNSPAASFCTLAWRTSLPSEFMIREGKHLGLAPLSFVDTIKRIKSIFGIAASAQPTQAVLNGLSSFVSGDLATYMPQLTQAVPATGPYDTIFNQLKNISQALSAALVPATAPPGLNQSQITQYQSALISFISSNRLQPVETLLVAARTIVNSSNGKYHLYLRLGLPALIMFRNDFASDTIFALTSEKDNALRIFLREEWEEALPSPNGVTSAVLDNSHPDHRAVAALASDHSDTQVDLCPTNDYMIHIENT